MASIPVSDRIVPLPAPDTGTTGRTGKQWSLKPQLPDSHTVNTRIYTDPQIFQEEIEKIWSRVWLPVCHESELPEPLDFRTTGLAGNKPIVIVRGEDNRIRAFLNICPHRNNLIVRSPAGSLRNAQPSGNAKHMTCMYHGWQFNAKGQCVEIPRPASYQERVCKEGSSLRQLRTEVAYGGMVWVNLDDDSGPLEDFVGHALDPMLEQLETEQLEIFHYQKGIVRTNYKLFFDTSREFYHDYLHFVVAELALEIDLEHPVDALRGIHRERELGDALHAAVLHRPLPEVLRARDERAVEEALAERRIHVRARGRDHQDRVVVTAINQEFGAVHRDRRPRARLDLVQLAESLPRHGCRLRQKGLCVPTSSWRVSSCTMRSTSFAASSVTLMRSL
jgi:nitrite reductase/ring-hydroxylating ferredoxin subunit